MFQHPSPSLTDTVVCECPCISHVFYINLWLSLQIHFLIKCTFRYPMKKIHCQVHYVYFFPCLVFYSTFSILLKCILLNWKASVTFFLLFSRFARSFSHQFIYKYSIDRMFSFKYLVMFSFQMVHKCAINNLKTGIRLFL